MKKKSKYWKISNFHNLTIGRLLWATLYSINDEEYPCFPNPKPNLAHPTEEKEKRNVRFETVILLHYTILK